MTKQYLSMTDAQAGMVTMKDHLGGSRTFRMIPSKPAYRHRLLVELCPFLSALEGSLKGRVHIGDAAEIGARLAGR